MPLVILYRYDGSPFSAKIEHVLRLKGIPHYTVNVSPVLPRPDIERLGLAYRRIPVLLHDRDVYCDTRLIAAKLDTIGQGTIFPPRKNNGTSEKALIEAFSTHFVEAATFPLAANLLPWEHLPASLIKDRSTFAGAPLNVKTLVASRSIVASKLATLLSPLESQLRDGREWIFDTTSPSLADISVFFVVDWVRSFKHLQADPPINKDAFPNILLWATRLEKRLKAAAPQHTGITGDNALKLLSERTEALQSASDPSSVDAVEAKRLGLKFGDTVSIAPEDTGRNHPTVGRLIKLNLDEIVIETKGSVGILRCHFPRIGYNVKLARHLKSEPKL